MSRFALGLRSLLRNFLGFYILLALFTPPILFADFGPWVLWTLGPLSGGAAVWFFTHWPGEGRS